VTDEQFQVLVHAIKSLDSTIGWLVFVQIVRLFFTVELRIKNRPKGGQ